MSSGFNAIFRNDTQFYDFINHQGASGTNASYITAQNYTSSVVVSSASDVVIPLTDYQIPQGFSKVGNTYFNNTGSQIKVLVNASVCASKSGGNCYFQLIICKDLGIGGIQRIIATTEHIDKAEGHNVDCHIILFLNNGEGIFIAGRTDTSNITLIRQTIAGNQSPSANLSVIEI